MNARLYRRRNPGWSRDDFHPSGRSGFIAPWTPANLGSYVRYDTEHGQPKNVGYVRLGGVAGDYIYTVDKNPLDIVGDLEIVLYLSDNNWSSTSGTDTYVGKWSTVGNNRSWRLDNLNGILTLYSSADGAASVANTLTTNLSTIATNDVPLWLKLEYDLDDGAGNRVLTVRWASEQIGEPSSWSVLQTVTTAGAVASIYASTAALEVGSYAGGVLQTTDADVRRAIVRNGIAGSIVADFDASKSYVSGFADAYGNEWIVGTSKTYDRSTSLRAPIVNAAGTAAGTPLGYRGTPYVFLATAGAGTNSVSCTAPATTASYSAVPWDGGTPTTGAASPGAFTFTTAGRWASISLLDGSAAELAKYDAASSTPTGHTDIYAVAWTLNYGTAGLKTTLLSPTASSAESLWVYGTNDYATGPAAAVPPATAGAACTLYCVSRPSATLTANMTFFSTRSGTGAGVTLRMASATTVVADVSDGTTTVTTPAVTITPGLRYVLGVVLTDGAPGTAYCFANNTVGSTVARNGTTETGGALTISAISTPTNYLDHVSRVPFAAISRAITVSELAHLVAYYKGGS